MVLVILLLYVDAISQSAAVAKGTSSVGASRKQVQKLVNQVQDADYRADQTALQRIYMELEPFADVKVLGAKVRYWRGFAQWRRGVNGLNDSVDPKELEQDFKLAIAEFESALSKDPNFVDARLAAGASMGLLSYLYGFTPAFAAERAKDPTRVREIVSKALKYVNEAETAQPENPRVLWVLGQIRWTMPPEMGGGQPKAIETNEKGLRLAVEGKGLSADALMPSWGKPELMMNLAINHLRRKEPDLAAAEKYARSALEIVPNWHYVRDILLPQIEAARAKIKGS